MGPRAAQKCSRIIQDKIKITFWKTLAPNLISDDRYRTYCLKSLGNLGEHMKALNYSTRFLQNLDYELKRKVFVTCNREA